MNGHVALDEGEMTGARGGRTLRRQVDGSVCSSSVGAGSMGNHLGKGLVQQNGNGLAG